jgi:hypothetical protein
MVGIPNGFCESNLLTWVQLLRQSSEDAGHAHISPVSTIKVARVCELAWFL